MRKPNGEPYLSGTEWEYEDAVNSPRQPRPRVLVYRRTEEPQVGLRDPQKKEKEKQFEGVEAFFAQFRNANGSLKGGVNEYETPSNFKDFLRQHLEHELCQRMPTLKVGDRPTFSLFYVFLPCRNPLLIDPKLLKI